MMNLLASNDMQAVLMMEMKGGLIVAEATN